MTRNDSKIEELTMNGGGKPCVSWLKRRWNEQDTFDEGSFINIIAENILLTGKKQKMLWHISYIIKKLIHKY